MSSKAPSQRQLRVGEEVRHVLAQVFLRREFRDPVLAAAAITVTEVRLSPDFRHATVFISRLGRSDVSDLVPNLERAAAYLRGQVARSLRLRVAPDLHWQPDEAIEYAQHVSELLSRPEVARDLPVEEGESDG